MQSIKALKRVGIVLLVTSAVGMSWPSAVGARGHSGSRDPLMQGQRQRKRTEEHKAKHREEIDLEGAATRDAKKSTQDSHQADMQMQLGTPNQQTDRWNLF